MQSLEQPSPFLQRHLDATVIAADGRPVADLACGRGRHALLAAKRGLVTIALDRNRDFLSELRSNNETLPITCVECDLESSHGPPLRSASCGAVFVFRFLYRSLVPGIVDCLAPGGYLLYETFTEHQLELEGGPKNPNFLLKTGELPKLFSSLEIVEYSEELRAKPQQAVATLLARQPL